MQTLAGRSLPISLTIEGIDPDLPDFGMIQLTATYEKAQHILPPVEPEQLKINLYAICTLFDTDEQQFWNIIEDLPPGSPLKEKVKVSQTASGSTKFFLTDILKVFRHHYANCLVAV